MQAYRKVACPSNLDFQRDVNSSCSRIRCDAAPHRADRMFGGVLALQHDPTVITITPVPMGVRAVTVRHVGSVDRLACRIPANGQRAPAIAAEWYARPFSPKFPQDRGENMAIRIISPWRDMERTDLSPIRQHEKDGPEHCAQRLYAQAAMGPGQCPSRRWRNAHPQAIPQPYRG